MAVDLSKARKGDKVKFRCGGEVELTADVESFGAGYYIQFDNSYRWLYWPNGFYEGRDKETGCSPFHIDELIQVPFEWSDARPGMGFIDNSDGEVVRYIGPALHQEKAAICARSRGHEPYLSFPHRHLIRAPQHDRPVPG